MVEAASSRGSSNIAFFVPFLSWLIKNTTQRPPHSPLPVCKRTHAHDGTKVLQATKRLKIPENTTRDGDGG